MNTVELIQDAKWLTRTPLLNESSLDTEVDDALTIAFWMRQLNKAQNFHQNKIVQLCQEYFAGSGTISYASGTNAYSIPGASIQIRMIERVGTNYNTPMHPVVLNVKNDYISVRSYPTNTQYPQFYYIWGNNINVIDADNAGTATVFYVRRLPDILYGTVTSPTTTTIVLPATPTLGTVHDEDDYYNNCKINIISATTGAGQSVTVSDYVGSTRTCTLSSAPSTALTGTIVAEIACEIPEEHHPAVSAYMACLGRIADQQAIEPDLKELHAVLFDEMISSIVPRDASEARHVHNPYRTL